MSGDAGLSSSFLEQIGEVLGNLGGSNDDMNFSASSNADPPSTRDNEDKDTLKPLAMPRPMRAAPGHQGPARRAASPRSGAGSLKDSALNLYRLSYHNGVAAPGAPALDEWMRAARAALEQMDVDPRAAYLAVLQVVVSAEVLATPADEAVVREALWRYAPSSATPPERGATPQPPSTPPPKRFKFC
jgi:hypothetical protein